MMDWTDRHERFFLRRLTRFALLYTEMITGAALVHGDTTRLLRYHPEEQPLAIQLGGSDPAELARAAELAEVAGFVEINLNIGCPSSRVQTGRFGACLMAEPELVARCVGAIRDRVSLPVTIKCRIGIDAMDSDAELEHFIARTAEAGCSLYIIHARIALLQGLSPRENREIPPLNYQRVYRMKEKFPDIEIVLNGGINTLEQAREVLTRLDGTMVGREAYQNPYLLSRVDNELFGAADERHDRIYFLQSYLPYVESELVNGTPLQHMSRHVLGLFRGEPGGRKFRQHLSQHAHRNGAGLDVLLDAMAYVS